MIDTLLEIWNKILTSNLFNFVLMLVFLGWIIEKTNMGQKLEEGRKSIEDKITNAKLNKENAAKILFETQEKGAEVDKEVFETIEKAERNAVIVGEKIIAEAEKQSAEYGKNIKATIDSNIEKLKLNLTTKTAQKAISMAKKHVEEQLEGNRELHIKYINESIVNICSISGSESFTTKLFAILACT